MTEEEKEELIEEIVWYLEDLLPYLHESTMYEDVDYLPILADLGYHTLRDDAEDGLNTYAALDSLFVKELLQIWFIIQEWTINFKVFEKHARIRKQLGERATAQ
jgi:hypothetical protein